MMQENYQLHLSKGSRDTFGYLTLDHCWEYHKINGKVKTNERIFKRIIKLYLKKVFDILMDGRKFEFPNFGDLFMAKILCTKFNPKSYKKDYIDVDKNDGFYYFVAWDRAKRYRTHKLVISRKWKKAINEIYVKTNKDTIEIR